MKSKDFDTGPLADVTAREDDGRWTLTFIRILRHPREKVWAALTDPDRLAKWAPYTADRNLGRTGDAILTMLGGESAQGLGATVTRAEAPTLLEYTWGEDRLRWKLDAVDAGTRLTLHHTVQGQEWLSKVAAGWHLCLIVAEYLLDGHPITPIVGEDAHNYGWDQLNDAYAKRLTPDHAR
ncbi:MAG: hypothetical protein QOD72_351 [Acidimicrobiaceae bacterium]|nr:hypothetical protein [Acidimicrobiaceae bacterium]